MKERVILVGVQRKSEPDPHWTSLEELRRLADTAGAEVASSVTQRVDRFLPSTLIGMGKVEEIGALARQHKVRTVVFDEDLTASQQKNIEDRVPAKILDRTRLILDIFARRARTREGELQVELAQLSYLLPRLTGKWRAFSQQVGGIGTRGPGERKLEYERRHIQLRIRHLKRDIDGIRRERAVRRESRLRVPAPQAAIIGYTNVGKSSLLNTLVRLHSPEPSRDGGEVYADNRLFATLDPTTRRVRLGSGGWALFTDTVGFIQKLPTHIVAAFRSTLEEVTLADCLLVLEDATAPAFYRSRQREAVDAVLKELGADRIPRLNALNKCDLLGPGELQNLRRHDPSARLVSAKTGQGIPDLLKGIEAELSSRWQLREMTLDYRERGWVGEIQRCAQILKQSQWNGRWRLLLRITVENWRRLEHHLAKNRAI